MESRIMLHQKLQGIVQIIRPELPFAAGTCVVLGEIVALGGMPPLPEALLGFTCGFFISGSLIVLNDYFDLEVDRVNSPERPLPAGLISPSEAIALTVMTAAIGLGAALWLGVSVFLLCSFFWLIGILYNWKFKEAGLAGNLMVSANVGFTFILGGMAVGEPWDGMVWCFALMAFLIDLGEEIAGDAMDIEGDKIRSSRSIAILKGREYALRLSSVLFSLVILVSWIPVLLGWMGISYLVLITITDLLILAFTIRLWRSDTPEEGRRAMRGIYLGALFGLLAAILGQVF
jgi:geranylgeranylglycerol-phosphate geranylgeranyltransferase